MVVVNEFDALAEHYDVTRGGEQRGDEYAADIDAHLPAGEGPVLEIGVGTGVVALGLRRRGRAVVGVDISAPMLRRANERLGPSVVLGDAMALPVGRASVAHAVSVWVVHAVPDPVRLFREVVRVMRPGGRYVVCAVQRPAADDPVGRIIADLGVRVDERRGATRPRAVTTEETLGWAATAGLIGTVHELERQWLSSPDEELAAIEHRQWPALRELDETAIEDVTRPAVEALRALPPTEMVRRATAELIVFQRR
jgi:ubiquinone/menaquinone biosynthesis C-methylase UbiE